MSTKNDQNRGVLVVRLGAMGDLLHALPAAASLKHSFPERPLTWVVEAAWRPLLEGNPFIDRIVVLDRKRPAAWLQTLRDLRARSYSVAVDFQGLIKSGVVAGLSRAESIVGFDDCRERQASWFYSRAVHTGTGHVVDRNLELAQAAGASNLLRTFPIPSGKPEGQLPDKGFVLASPLAGWASKQWPMEYYAELASMLARKLNLMLVLNGPPSARVLLTAVPNVVVHLSSLSGLIDATRRAVAVVGVDSGPMHLAAALGKPGVAIFGPTDPVRNGPYGGTLTVVRSGEAVTSYKRGGLIDLSMRAVKPQLVMEHLETIACAV